MRFCTDSAHFRCLYGGFPVVLQTMYSGTTQKGSENGHYQYKIASQLKIGPKYSNLHPVHHQAVNSWASYNRVHNVYNNCVQ
eukprot:SAG22_NODE_164_length_16817_cov_61.573573_18_plen_82_part_00